MTILYEGFRGNEPNIFLGILCSVIGLVLLAFFILSIKERESGAAAIIVTMLLIVIAIILTTFTSHRYPIVRATLDDTVLFKEVYEHYELIDVEGEIYTFRVKDINE